MRSIRIAHLGWALVVATLGALVVLGVPTAVPILGTASTWFSHQGPALAAPGHKISPLSIIATTPKPNDNAVTSAMILTVSFSEPLATNTALPALNPAVTGSWVPIGARELQFQAKAPLLPGAQETLTIPAATTAQDGDQLGAAQSVPFTVAQGSTLRLQQLLAELDYLPVSFVPSTEPSSPQGAAQPQQGTFAWRWATQPSSLTSQWVPGTYGVITKGAVMSFETQNGLTTTGEAGPQVWSALLASAGSGQSDKDTYAYVSVSKTLPETATVYQNGVEVYSTLCNTGAAGAPTQTGTFPVYARYTVTTMVGTNPNGTHYVDPGIPWVSYFNGGDALHGYVRASYGFPQSNGCVEMPPTNAKVVYPLTPIGTLVTVQ